MLKSPYNYLKGDENTKRVSGHVSLADYNHIRGIRPSAGTVEATIGHMWKKLCEKLSDLNIIDYNHVNELESTITNFIILTREEYDTLTTSRGLLTGRRLSDSSIGGTEQQVFPGNDNRGEASASVDHSSTPSESTNLPLGSGSERSTKTKSRNPRKEVKTTTTVEVGEEMFE